MPTKLSTATPDAAARAEYVPKLDSGCAEAGAAPRRVETLCELPGATKASTQGAARMLAMRLLVAISMKKIVNEKAGRLET